MKKDISNVKLLLKSAMMCGLDKLGKHLHIINAEFFGITFGKLSSSLEIYLNYNS